MWPLRNAVLVLMASSSVFVSGIETAGCPLCTERSIFKEMTKEAIKEDILRKLGLSSPPTVNVNISDFSQMPYVQNKMKELNFQNDVIPGLGNQSDEDDDSFQPRTITILATMRPPVHNVPSALYFQLPSQDTDSLPEMEKAELSIHLPPGSSCMLRW